MSSIPLAAKKSAAGRVLKSGDGEHRSTFKSAMSVGGHLSLNQSKAACRWCHFCRPWMSGKSVDVQPVGCHIGSLLTDLGHFKESCCRICHCHTMKFNACFGLLFVSEFAWTHWVNTQCVPRNDFQSGLRWKQTCLLVTLLAHCAVFAVLADTHTCGSESNPCAALRHGEFKSLFTRMH